MTRPCPNCRNLNIKCVKTRSFVECQRRFNQTSDLDRLLDKCDLPPDTTDISRLVGTIIYPNPSFDRCAACTFRRLQLW